MPDSTPSSNALLTCMYQDHHAWLQAWLRRKTHCLYEAENMAQETFCRLLMISPEQLRQLENPRAFLVKTATRLLIDQSRREAIERAYLEALSIGMESQTAPSAEAYAQTLELLGLIARMLDDLPEKPRRAFLLNRFEGFTHAEIAAQLHVSPSMVKQYIAQVMVHCYAIAYGEDDGI